jgi:hypothetical protein
MSYTKAFYYFGHYIIICYHRPLTCQSILRLNQYNSYNNILFNFHANTALVLINNYTK